jgi:nitrate/TMAO reductase-like tetraheme cytochrome c subunit
MLNPALRSTPEGRVAQPANSHVLHRQPPKFSIYRNWLSLAGLVVACASLFAFLLLFTLDFLTHSANPYLGILTYLVSPAFLIIGLGLIGAGWIAFRRALHKRIDGQEAFFVELDFARPEHRRKLIWFVAGTMVFLLLTALGSYQTYHFTESNAFCGEVCHTVMEPEYTTYQQGAHARVACVECHIGSGAEWYVKSKLSGLYQVYSVAFEKYSRPIPTPVHNLRPAQDTCEQCHWPKKFIGNLDRTYDRFLADDENTPFSVRLSLKVGGGDPALGQTGGIHWHMNAANKVEFVSTDEDHMKIVWVRTTDRAGVEREYFAEGVKERPEGQHHVMDCVDCHTRPAHSFGAPNDLVDRSLAFGSISRDLKNVRAVATRALNTAYSTREEAKAGIEAAFREAYGDDANAAAALAEVHRLYSKNFFPEMKARWDAYPNQIGHKDWPGCFRCHDGGMKTREGQAITADCNACHTILAQGKGEDLLKVAPKGLEFDHPGGDVSGSRCSECHTGAPMDG